MDDQSEGTLGCGHLSLGHVVPLSGQRARVLHLWHRDQQQNKTLLGFCYITIELLSYNPELGRGRLEISCSKGTYVRSVIHDMGQDLGCGAVMTDLIRTKACGFSLEDCTSLEKLQELASANIPADRYTYPIEKVFSYLPKLVLNEKQEKMYRNGRRLDMNRIDFNVPDAGKVRVCGADGHFIGTAVIINELAELRADKNFDVK